MENLNCELKLINMEDIKCENVEWLWYPFVPYGKITIIQGDPGEGKTTFSGSGISRSGQIVQRYL